MLFRSKAYAVVNRLAARPAEALPLLRDRLHAAEPLPAERLRRLIANLDDDDVAVRDAATRDLAGVVAQAAPALRDALTGGVSPEQRRRIEGLLEGVHRMQPGDALRGVRAVRVLERIGSSDSHRILDALSSGDPAAPLTQEARDALARLAARND